MTRHDTAQWDRQVQVRLARGEAAALGETYDRHARLVHAIAVRLLGEEKAAREVVTAVFSQLWQHPEAFDPTRHRLSTWLAMEACERAGKRVRDGGPGGPARTTEIEQADAVLASVNSRTRVALHLVYTGNMDYRQAAAQLGITEDEVLSRLRLGLQMLSGGVREDER
ncbi:sigma factor [Streptomyces sp. cg35]|uniref:sigma factor n=1 Tax=Streptomyces sp. cg35 TaxID=3421650 RepID=UPI003D164457